MKSLWTFLYSFIAAICDLYFLSFALGALVALGGLVFQEPAPLPLLMLVPIMSLVAAILYHVVFSRRGSWRTPGEQLVGCVIEPDGKVWRNPYGRNRWALFVIILMTIMLASNAWDSLSLGLVYTFSEIAARVILLAALYYGLVQIGKGQPRGLLYIVAFFAILSIIFLNTQTNLKVQQFVVASSIVAIVVHSLVVSVYHFLRRTESREAKR